MYSTFYIKESATQCMACTNQTLKSLGTLRGIFGAEIDRIDGRIVVSHTDEVSREEIATHLATMGYIITENGQEQDIATGGECCH